MLTSWHQRAEGAREYVADNVGPGHLRARKIWIDDALGAEARC
jgi:hypothetical protein